MMKFMILPFLALVSTVSLAKEIAPADRQPPRRVLPVGTEISIDRYVKDTNVFEILITDESDVGPNIATPEHLQAAIKVKGSQEKFMQQMARDKSAVYVLKKELELLYPNEVKAPPKKPASK